jgi:RNA polymerase subunit RPABC4/transcription elongation factor Spt4
MTVAGLACTACSTELPSDSKFCNKCGTPVGLQHSAAEYKQVTVLFADVVHSMDIAASVGAERLREIMTAPSARRRSSASTRTTVASTAQPTSPESTRSSTIVPDSSIAPSRSPDLAFSFATCMSMTPDIA